mmetsp:Transcript_37788/g.52474  ORF Transcript_37788/g.52474 Transcript_37788/m.52474 type:complete len:471 (+) Transcript_37788:130-1542(+)
MDPSTSDLVLTAQSVESNDFNEAANFVLLCKGGNASLAAEFLSQALSVVQPNSNDRGGSRKKARVDHDTNGEQIAEPTFESLDFSYVCGDELDLKLSTTVVLVPTRGQLLGAIIGKGGSYISHIQSATGSKVQIEKKEQHSVNNTHITITGTVKNNNAAVALIMNKVFFHMKLKGESSDPTASSIKIIVPNPMVRHLIGKGGSVINHLQSTASAHIQFQNEKEMAYGSAGREVIIKGGETTNLCKAEYLLSRKMVEENNYDPNWGSSVLRSSNSSSSHSQGAGGGMGSYGNAPPQLPQQNSGAGGYAGYGSGADPSGMLGGMGSLAGMGGLGGYDPSVLLQLQQQQQQAQLLLQLQQQLAGGGASMGVGGYSNPPLGPAPSQGNGSESGTSIELAVPNWTVSRLIGKGGATIQEMQQKTGCRIQYQKENEMQPGSSERKLTLIGTGSAIAAAQQLVSATVAQLQAAGLQP